MNAYPNTELHPRRMGAIVALVVLVTALAFAASPDKAAAPDQFAIEQPALDPTGLARAMSLEMAPEIDQDTPATLAGDDPTAFGLPPSPAKVSEPQRITFSTQPVGESTELALAARPVDESPAVPQARSDKVSDTCPECVRAD